MLPVLSIIIPVYNAEKYLAQTISSVLNQDLKNLEIICVDDGSTDRSAEIINLFSKIDNRVKYIYQKNQHAGVARNRGLITAKGEYVHFLDADDFVLDNGYYAVVHEAKIRNLDCIKFCAINYDCINGKFIDIAPEKYHRIKSELFHHVTRVERHPELLQLRVTPWTGIYKRSFLERKKISFNSLACVNDRSFFHEVLFFAKRLMVVDNKIMVHRSNVSNSLIQNRAQHFECHYESIKMVEEFLLTNKAKKAIRTSVLSLELDDLLVWYGTYQNHPEYKKMITYITTKTINEFAQKYPELSVYQNLLNSFLDQK